MTRLRTFSWCVLLLSASSLATAAGAARELRVCADPDNLPFSNNRLEGFENKIARLIADELHASLQYVWSGQILQQLNAGKCDMVMGAPTDWGPVLTTRPYYTSSYVFIYAKKKHPSLSSFDDPVLQKLRIGLPVISSAGANPPTAYALARRGLASNVIGFPMFPPGKIIDAVSAGDIDVALVWGPLGGYFAKHQSIPLAVTPVAAGSDDSSLRFTYEISMGVKRGDTAFKEELERVLERRQNEIRKVLEEYGVPVLPATGGGALSAQSIQ